ncbi:hypothetical protein ACWELJ_20510 [Nocardia sp. NPDC004582]
MVEPVTVGIAAAALLATKFGERFATDAGASAWSAIKNLKELIAAKFKGDNETETAVAALAKSPNEDAQAVVAARISEAARVDATFRYELERLLALARQDPATDTFVAQAFDNAKQVNFRGDNLGQINL